MHDELRQGEIHAAGDDEDKASVDRRMTRQVVRPKELANGSVTVLACRKELTLQRVVGK
jgi:hypothetical protein